MAHKSGARFKHPAPGELVRVNGHHMHVFSEGQGAHTLVFLSGHGTASPTLDFKPLWSRLTDKYRIAVVEKFGYGWSDITKRPRDLDTMLAETREALQLAGIAPPYVLVPHSLSGLEAIYWAQKYPEEVEAIIALDPSIPAFADAIKVSPATQAFMKVMSALVIPLMGKSDTRKALKDRSPSPSYKSDALTDGDRDAYVELFKHRTMSPDILREIKYVQGNMNMINALPLPADVPLCLFSSTFQDVARTGRNPEEFLAFHQDFVSNFKTAKHFLLDCGHYVHAYAPEQIAQEMEGFLESLES
ncbi:MAG: alpha/beta hydrolase [Oscillospiraceae bacterium]|nr:alpha/beta hydrolase [Oscillospiraceae bacterium]